MNFSKVMWDIFIYEPHVTLLTSKFNAAKLQPFKKKTLMVLKDDEKWKHEVSKSCLAFIDIFTFTAKI